MSNMVGLLATSRQKELDHTYRPYRCGCQQTLRNTNIARIIDNEPLFLIIYRMRLTARSYQ